MLSQADLLRCFRDLDRDAVDTTSLQFPLAPHPVTNAEFTRTVARHYHRPAFLHVSAWVLRTALRDQTSMFLFSQRVRPGVPEASG